LNGATLLHPIPCIIVVWDKDSLLFVGGTIPLRFNCFHHLYHTCNSRWLSCPGLAPAIQGPRYYCCFRPTSPRKNSGRHPRLPLPNIRKSYFTPLLFRHEPSASIKDFVRLLVCWLIRWLVGPSVPILL
jgi:hypothetical protein